MTTKDFIRKWGAEVHGQWWLADAGRTYWAASYKMARAQLAAMSQGFLNLRNLDSYRGTSSMAKALEVCQKENILPLGMRPA